MSANHVPMHYGTGCERCARRKVRLDAYRGRMAHQASPAGQKAAAKEELLLIKRAADYADKHRQGRRASLLANRHRNAVQRARAAEMRRLEALPPRGRRVKRAYCAGLGHKWSGPRMRNNAGALRECLRGSCHATEFIKPPKPATKAA